jgi:hypothetical protein
MAPFLPPKPGANPEYLAPRAANGASSPESRLARLQKCVRQPAGLGAQGDADLRRPIIICLERRRLRSVRCNECE